jgi:hypothetical protein
MADLKERCTGVESCFTLGKPELKTYEMLKTFIMTQKPNGNHKAS